MGNWNQDPRWGGTEPTAIDVAFINFGTVSVTRAGEVASQLYVGDAFNSNGNLVVMSGGDLSNGYGYIGHDAGAMGTVTVNGAGSTWSNSSSLLVGRNGNGTLNIQDGGTVNSSNGHIGTYDSSTGTAIVSGADSTWNNSNFLFVGNEGGGTLNIQDGGAVLSAQGVMGRETGSTGTAAVTGNGSIWHNSISLSVGRLGTGSLDVNTGGQVLVGDIDPSSYSAVTGIDIGIGIGDSRDSYNAGHFIVNAGSTTTNDAHAVIGLITGSTGKATVSGVGATWSNAGGLYLGGSATAAGGTGTLNVLDSGTVTFDGPLKIWNAASTLNVDGGNLNANAGLDNTLGGTLNHTDGTLTVTGGVFAPNAGGPADDYLIDGADALDNPLLVIGSGATTAIGKDLIIAENYNGLLRVQEAGVVTNAAGIIGNTVGSTGAATVTGIGSAWNNSGFMVVGSIGTGTMDIADGGTVTNADGFIGSTTGSTGTATVTGNGSTWENDGALYIGGHASAAGGTGTLNVLDSGTVDVADTLKIWNAISTLNLDGGTLHASTIENTLGGAFNFLDGTLQVGTFDGTLTQNGGTLAPGNSPGMMQIVGDFNLNTGNIEVELAGLTPGSEHDFIDITGTMNLGAASVLDVLLIDPFIPSFGDSFDLFDFSSLTGSFGTINLPTLDVGLTWDTSNLYTDGSITVVPEPGTLALLGISGLMLIRRRRA